MNLFKVVKGHSVRYIVMTEGPPQCKNFDRIEFVSSDVINADVRLRQEFCDLDIDDEFVLNNEELGQVYTKTSSESIGHNAKEGSCHLNFMDAMPVFKIVKGGW